MTQSNTKKAEKLKQSANDIVDFNEKLRKTKEFFPKLDIIYSAVDVFGEDAYKRVIMAYKDPELTKLLADYFEELVGYKFPGTDILSLYVGIGDTDKIRKQYPEIDTPQERQTVNRKICRRGPNGLHHKILARIDGRDAGYLNSQIIPHGFLRRFSGIDKNASNLIEAYIEGNRQAMLEALPEGMRTHFDHGITGKYNVPDGISADDLHRIGKWLTELNKMPIGKSNQDLPRMTDCRRLGGWLQETFPANEKSSQNIAITSAIKDAKSNKR